MPSVETETSLSGGKIRLAVADGQYCALLLPVAITDAAGTDKISQMISVQPVTLGLDGKAVRFLEVRCEDERLDEVFARVVSDVLRRIEAGSGAQKSVDEALKEFRRLLHKQRVTAQDEKTIVGLIGELLTLIEALEVNSAAVSAWHGPNSDRHDFRAGRITIEVKTSLGADGSKIHINGIRQLEVGDNDSLLLRHVRVEPDPNGDLTVPALVERAGVYISELGEFEDKLAKLGYTDDVRESWEASRYRKVTADAYEVRDGFPRLTPSLLNTDWPVSGVSGVSYEVNLGEAAECRIDDAGWDARLKDLCACL